MRFIPLFFLPLTLASPLSSLFSRKDSPLRPTSVHGSPTVQLHPGSNTCDKEITITGKYEQSFDQDLYLGVPYALPPIGPKRFRPPEPFIYDNNIIAQQHAPACLQKPNTTADGHYGMSEDCLFLDIYSPHRSHKDGKSKIPVVVYIHGGAFVEGTASIYNGSYLVSHSQKIGQPIIFVAVNFRLGIFGFGYGSGFADNKAANLALRDNIASLQWVKDNIDAFRGDPNKVTVLGGSSGSVAISLLFLDPQFNLFRSAIISSGAQSSAPIGPTGTTWEDAYQQLLVITNCTSPEETENSFECLRLLPAQELLTAQFALKADPRWAGSFIFAPSIDGDLIPKSPYQLLEEGLFARLPFIAGNVKDEGTEFIPPSIVASQVGAVIQAIEPIDLSSAKLEALQEMYPIDPSLGSKGTPLDFSLKEPFGTGNETFGLDPGFKQASAIFGDVAFQAPRRHFLQAANKHGFGKTWTYQFEQISPDRPAYLGVSHATDVPYFLGEAKPGIGDAHYQQFNYTVEDSKLSDIMMNYWINFIYHSNPNPKSHWSSWSSKTHLPNWSKYNSKEDHKNMLRLKFDQVELIRDDYREEAMQFIYDNAIAFNYKRGLGQQ